MENIIENNKLIADFMNLNLYNSFLYKSNIATEKQICKENNLKFHSDWNWLMEVVEKIEKLKCTVVIEKNICRIHKWGLHFGHAYKFETKIEAVYNACVEFIKWYYENK